MNIVMIEQTACEHLTAQVSELAGLVGTLASKTLSAHSDEWLDTQEVCKALNITKRTAQNYRASGRLPYSFIGSKIYHNATDIAEILQSGLKRG